MTAKKVVQGLLVTLALFLTATTGRAQGYRIFLMGGASSLADDRSFTERYKNFDSSYAGGGKGIFGVEMPFYKIFGLEVSYGIGSNNLEITNKSTSPTTTISYPVRNNRFSGDLVGHIPGTWRGMRFYGVVGLEYNLFAPTSAAQSKAKTEGFAFAPSATLSSDSKPGFNAGGGIDYKVTSKVDLRLEARDHMFGSPTFGLPQAPTSISSAYFPISGSARNLEYSIGLVYRFGKSK
jgi:opacity protein-like surface antigen